MQAYIIARDGSATLEDVDVRSDVMNGLAYISRSPARNNPNIYASVMTGAVMWGDVAVARFEKGHQIELTPADLCRLDNALCAIDAIAGLMS